MNEDQVGQRGGNRGEERERSLAFPLLPSIGNIVAPHGCRDHKASHLVRFPGPIAVGVHVLYAFSMSLEAAYHPRRNDLQRREGQGRSQQQKRRFPQTDFLQSLLSWLENECQGLFHRHVSRETSRLFEIGAGLVSPSCIT